METSLAGSIDSSSTVNIHVTDTDRGNYGFDERGAGSLTAKPHIQSYPGEPSLLGIFCKWKRYGLVAGKSGNSIIGMGFI
jgi:hypothetical protein